MSKFLRVLVTGASGFLGANIIKYLVDRNVCVLATSRKLVDPLMDYYLKGSENYVDWIKVDVSDYKQVMGIAENYIIDGVIHAAFVTPGLGIEYSRSRDILNSNINGTINVLELAKKTDLKKFIFTSSSGVYPSSNDVNKTVLENSIEAYTNMKGLYHISKITCEKIVERYSQLFSFSGTSMRIPVIYGPMERPTNSRINMSPVFKLFNLVLKENIINLNIYGLKYASDWTYVMDVVQGLVAALESDKPLRPVYNISCGERYDLVNFLNALKNVSEFEFSWKEVNKIEEADYSTPINRMRGPLNIEKVKQDFEFKPEYGPKEGISEYYKWWTDVTKKDLW